MRKLNDKKYNNLIKEFCSSYMCYGRGSGKTSMVAMFQIELISKMKKYMRRKYYKSLRKFPVKKDVSVWFDEDIRPKGEHVELYTKWENIVYEQSNT